MSSSAPALVPATRVPGTIGLSLGVIWTVSLLVIRRGIALLLFVPLVLGRLVQIQRLVRLAPLSVVTVTTLAGTALCTDVVSGWVRSQTHGQTVYLCLAGCVLALFTAVTNESVAIIPLSYADIERDNRRWPDRWLSARMRRAEDAAMARLYLRLSVPVVPFLILAVTEEGTLIPLAFYLAATAPAASLVEALDHADIHTDAFSWRHLKGTDRFVFRVLQIYAQWLFVFFYWRMPQWYPVQHISVHHAEDNSAEDTQSTLGLDRTRFSHYCWAAMSFSLSSMFAHDVIAYLIRKRRYRQLRRLGLGMIVYYTAIGVIAWWAPPVALVLILMRLRLSVAAALLFFSWHALFEPNDPQNAFTNSINFKDDTEHGYFGASLHIEHHLRPALHWTQVPALAQKNRVKHIENGSLAFTLDLTPREFMRALWTHEFARICAFVVRPEGDTRSDAQLVETFRRRSGAEDGPSSHQLESAFGRVIAATLL